MLLSRAFCVHSNKKENLPQLKIEVLGIAILPSKPLILRNEMAGLIAFLAITGNIPPLRFGSLGSVSYTHLTLPTILLV